MQLSGFLRLPSSTIGMNREVFMMKDLDMQYLGCLGVLHYPSTIMQES